MQLSKLSRLLPPAARPLVRRPLVRYRFRDLRADDAVLVSYPKSGSTWFRFLLSHVLTGREADYDAIRETMPAVKRHGGAPRLLPSGGRVLRTHELVRPWRGRPDQPVLYLFRDGRDVCLSYFNHVRRQGVQVDLPEFVELFVTGRVDGYGPWHEHVLAGLTFGDRRPGPSLSVRYEDLRADPAAGLARALAFLGVDATVEDVERAVAANETERMRAKEATSAFLRAHVGQTNGARRETRPWAEAVPDDLRRRFEEVCGPALSAAGYEPR